MPMLSINDGAGLESALPVLSLDYCHRVHHSSGHERCSLLALGYAGERLDQFSLTVPSTDQVAPVKSEEFESSLDSTGSSVTMRDSSSDKPGMLSQLLNSTSSLRSATAAPTILDDKLPSSNNISANMRIEHSQSALVNKAKGCSSCRYRGDARILVSGHWDHTVRIFDTKRLKPLAVLR